MEWILSTLMVTVAAVISLWMAGAIYFDLCDGKWWARLVLLGWIVAFAAMLLYWRPLWQPLVVLLAIFGFTLAWWLRLKPSNDRDWDPAVAVQPKAERKGETITIENVRNFDYHSLDDFTPRYETRTYHLANLTGVDLILFNWGSAIMSHPVLVFDFGPDGRICMSIEVRYQRDQ